MRWTAVLALLLLAGCLDDGPQAPGSLGGADADAGRQGRVGRTGEPAGVRTFDSSFDLVLNPDSELLLFTMLAGDRNCILFSEGDSPSYRILGGTATMTWDALTPLAEDLVLSVFGLTESLRVSGSSPLTVDLSGLELDLEGGGMDLMADHEVPQMPIRQSAKLQVTFDYEGEVPGPFQGFCTNGL